MFEVLPQKNNLQMFEEDAFRGKEDNPKDGHMLRLSERL